MTEASIFHVFIVFISAVCSIALVKIANALEERNKQTFKDDK